LPLTITQAPLAGAPLSVGSTNIIISVRDASNNLATCSVPVLVQRFYGPVANVPESSNYTLLCSLTLPNAANYNNTGVTYDIDHRRWLTNFSRVAYYVELQQSNSAVQFVWAAMDAFTPNANKLGVPSFDTGAFFQQPVTNLDVRSSAPGVVSGSGLTGGSIQFWSGLPAAPTGRGAMQVWNGT